MTDICKLIFSSLLGVFIVFQAAFDIVRLLSARSVLLSVVPIIHRTFWTYDSWPATCMPLIDYMPIPLALPAFLYGSNLSGIATLTKDLSMICFDEESGTMLGFAIACIVVYVVGCMCIFCYVIFMAPLRFQDWHSRGVGTFFSPSTEQVFIIVVL